MGQVKSTKIYCQEEDKPLWMTIRRRMLIKDLKKDRINLFQTLCSKKIVYKNL